MQRGGSIIGPPLLACALLTVFLLPVSSQTPSPTYPSIGRVIREDSRLDNLIPRDAKVEVLASGMKFSEGPVWVKDGGYLLFSDAPRNSVMKW